MTILPRIFTHPLPLWREFDQRRWEAIVRLEMVGKVEEPEKREGVEEEEERE